MSAKNPVQYAEEVLGVHKANDAAQAALNVLVGARNSLLTVNHELRAKREELTDKEADVTVTARADNAEMSDTAFQRHLRVVLQKDDDLATMRWEIIALQAQQDDAENAVRVAEKSVDAAVARLNELGGLLFFYGATKISGRSRSANP